LWQNVLELTYDHDDRSYELSRLGLLLRKPRSMEVRRAGDTRDG